MKKMNELVSRGKTIWLPVLVMLCLFFSYSSVNAQAITTDFTSDAVICGSGNVNFAATVQGNIALSDCKFEWNFGDGKPLAYGQTVSNGFPVTPGAIHTLVFSGPETPFTVTLNLYRVSTGALLATVKHDITIRPAPQPDLMDALNPAKPFDNCANTPTIQNPFFTIKIKNQSLDSNSISSYVVDWGDGTATTPAVKSTFPITHIYSKLGLFKLKLSATGVNGCTASKTFTVKNQGNPAIGISSGGNTTGCAPVTFAFKVNRVYLNDTSTTYKWDFGDGTTLNWTTQQLYANDSTVYHTFTKSSCNQANGYYIVKISATNGCQSTEASVGGVHVGETPHPSFSPTNLCEGEPVNFQNSTLPGMNFDCSKSIVFTWDFGDGSSRFITTSSGDIQHTFPAGNNTYTVKLIAYNDCKDSATYSQTITLTRKPVANATLSPLQGCGRTIVNAVNSSTGDIVTTQWTVVPATGRSFGNGTSTSSANPQFIFTTKGNYIVNLRESNNCTFSDKPFNVFINGPINVTFPKINDQCDTYTFDATLPSVFNLVTIPNEVVRANWQITPATGYTFLNGTTSTSLNPQIKFTGEGDYTMSVTLANGCDSVAFSKTFRFAFSPKAIATPSSTGDCIPFSVHFDNQSTGFKSTYLWSVTPTAGASFANGTTATTTSPDFQFTQTGNYIVKLTVTNSCGVNSQSYTIKAKDKPVVNLLPLPDICEGGNITINSALVNVSQNNGGTPIYNWVVTPNTGVNYINGTFNYSANPSYQFTLPGTYQIAVTVSNDCGTVTSTQTLNVRDAVHLVTSISDTAGCAPKIISFTDNSTGYQATHQWTVLPASGYTFATGSSTTASPSILFSQPGFYTITHTVKGLCSTQSKTFTVFISSFPSLNLFPIQDQCSLPYKLIIDSTNFKINENGKTLTLIHWVVTPGTNITYIDGTSQDSKYPHIQFNTTGLYTVLAEATNACGTSSTSQMFRVLQHATEKALPSVTSGCLSLNVNFTDQSIGDKLIHKWSVLPAAGWIMTPSSDSASPNITFNKIGIYTVTHKITNLCGSDSHTYTITVKDLPTVVLSPMPNSCNTFTFIADMQNMKVTPNLSDSVHYLWTVIPNRAVTFLSGTSDTSHYPVIQIADTGVFAIKVRATAECGFTETAQTVSITKGPQILLDPVISSQCLPADLTFPGTVYGQNLVYNWTVSPLAGANFINGTTSTSPRPQIRFSRSGNYSVSLKVSNNCSNDIKTWNYTVIGQPTILFNTVADTCDNFTFKAERYVVIQDNGNAISNNTWTVAPASGFTYVDGTTANSAFPHIFFTNANTYKITMNATNDCGVTSMSQSFTLDQFVQVTVGADTSLCTNSNLYPLKGTPGGGSWSIMPAAAANVLKLIGNSYFLDMNVPGNYTLTYKRGNSYCASQASRHINVMALPTVDAGRDITVCNNDIKPIQLVGNPTGGTWSGSGVTGSTFSANGLAPGSYILKYTWTDPVTTCTNTDQLVARLIAVPLTGFTVAIQSCKDAPVLFTPNGTAGTIFNWTFGDGQTATSSGSILHTYRTGGSFTVSMTSADPNNCSVSTSTRIFIQDDITLPVVTATPNRGCGPLSVTFKVDTTGTTGNGQNYKWDFGNGTVQIGPFTTKTIVYNQAIGDTTYKVTLTISNNCYTKSIVYPITVNSLPNADFVMPHAWECSPIVVQFKNQSKDRGASFLWKFGDGTTSTAFEPTHSFTTGKIATNYIVKLIATNGCGTDSISRPLLIKPNSIEAFLQMDKRQACTGDLVTFTNYSTDTVSRISNYYWDFGDGAVVNTWNATHAYTSAGKYTVTLFVDNGCSHAQTTDQIVILPPLVLTITSKDSICMGDTLNLSANSSLGSLINTKWDFGDNTIGTGAITTHAFTTSGWKTITFTAQSAASLLHCSGTATRKVFVKAIPILSPVKDVEGCAPIALSLKTPGIEGQLWNFGEDNIWTSSGIYTYYNTTSKPVRRKVTVVSENALGCQATAFFWVTIYPNPKAKIGIKTEEGLPEKVFLSSLSTNTTACEWFFPDGSTSQSCDSVLLKLYNNGFYKITLQSSNQYGCVDTTSIIHETIIKGMFVPNAFKPSDANAEVNTFKPIGIGLKSYWMGIYDTWGNLLWETTKLTDTKPVDGWAGTTLIGKNLPMDVYIWRIKAVYIDGTEWKGMKGKDGVLRTEGTITLIK